MNKAIEKIKTINPIIIYLFLRKERIIFLLKEKNMKEEYIALFIEFLIDFDFNENLIEKLIKIINVSEDNFNYFYLLYKYMKDHRKYFQFIKESILEAEEQLSAIDLLKNISLYIIKKIISIKSGNEGKIFLINFFIS